MNSPNFFAELKRRNVYKVAVAYGIVGWLVVQVGTSVLPAFHAPDWVAQTVIVLVMLGFPVALVIAWAFEMTPEGMKRTENISLDANLPQWSKRKFAAVFASLALIAAGLLAFRMVGMARWAVRSEGDDGHRSAVSLPIPEKSIAVLPFENLSSDKENAYFADGIQDEILTRLSKIGALKAISRTSTQKYKSAPDNLREVGKQLGVANILEGSVQKIGNAAHINVQLIRVATDEHLWAESYNRKLDDIFAVEGEVAGAIAEALNAKLTGAEKAVLAQRPTNNAAAYDAYLRGAAQYFRSNSQDEQEAAVRAFEEATRLDPQFAEAWAALSRSHSVIFFHSDVTATRRAAAEHALAEATRLRPDLAETQLARAYFQYWVLHDYKGALEMMRQLRNSWPSNPEIHQVMAFILARLGQWNESIESIDRVITLNPRDLFPRSQAIQLRLAIRDFPSVLHSADSALQIWPDNSDLHGLKASAFQALGRLDEAQSTLDGVIPKIDGSDSSLSAICYQARLRRDASVAIKILEPFTHGAELEKLPFLLSWAGLQLMAGKKTEAHALFERGRHILEQQTREQPRNAELLGMLAFVLNELGDGEAALQTVDKYAALSAGDARTESQAEEARARVLAKFGQTDRAIATIASILNKPSDGAPPLTPALLRLDPDWDNLRGDPRFAKLSQEPAK
jgi:TolB-like protein/Tfp pilus assembly protein PilF/thioredoxin-like negative regulator of GroEL